MGDTGSLFLGSAISVLAVGLKNAAYTCRRRLYIFEALSVYIAGGVV